MNIVKQMVEGNALEAILELVQAETSIAFIGLLIIGIIGSVGIYSGSWAVPVIMVIMFLPVFNVIIGASIVQMIVQFTIVVITGYIYITFRQRR